MQQSLLTKSGDDNPILLPLSQGKVLYYPNWLESERAANYFHQLQQELSWRQDAITLFGKRVKIPRLQAWYGDPHCMYEYSGLTLQPNPWHSVLAAIRGECETACESEFNCVLANWYRDGSDSMGMHADNEPELGINPTIASVTLGQPRVLTFKHKKEKEKYQLCLEHGSLLVMAGETQRFYNHGIAKSSRSMAARINLTYRYIYS